MRRFREQSKYHCFSILIILLASYMNAHGQKVTQFCKQADLTPNDAVLIEVKRIGTGMTWPLVPQLFFRVYEDGRIRYEVRSGRLVGSQEGAIDAATIEKLRKLVEADDLVESQLEYPMLAGVGDALMKTCVTYSRGDRYRQILLVNYMPDHPKAKGYYPASLVELLRLVQDLRPSNEYERKHGFDKLSFR